MRARNDKGKAIEIMQINRDGVANMSWSEDRTKTLAAFDMAIKALEQEPCEDANANQHNSNALNALEGDAISRQAVLEMAYDMSEIDGEHFTAPCMVVDVEDIQKLPSVNPQEPKTGH